MYLQFLKILDVKRKGSLSFVPEDLKRRSVLDIDDIPPVVDEILVALSLKHEDKGSLVKECNNLLTEEGGKVTLEEVLDVVERNGLCKAENAAK